jgi:hypothetical protein
MIISILDNDYFMPYLFRFNNFRNKKNQKFSMAATIRDARNENVEKKPVLIDRIDGFESDIFCAILLPNEDGFITSSDDRYWPNEMP